MPKRTHRVRGELACHRLTFGHHCPSPASICSELLMACSHVIAKPYLGICMQPHPTPSRIYGSAMRRQSPLCCDKKLLAH